MGEFQLDLVREFGTVVRPTFNGAIRCVQPDTVGRYLPGGGSMDVPGRCSVVLVPPARKSGRPMDFLNVLIE